MSRTQHCFDHSVFVYKDKRGCYDNPKRQEIKEKICNWQIQILVTKKNVKWEVATTFTSVRERLGAFWYGAVFSTSFKERGECWYSSRNTSKVEIYFTSLYVMGIGVIPQIGWRTTLQWN